MTSIDDIIAAVRAYALARWGQCPTYLKLTLPDGREQVEIVPAPPATATPATTPDAGRPWHSEDFARVRWPGLGEFVFGQKQATVVAALWDAMNDPDDSERDQQSLLEIAESEGTRLSDLFRGHPAWGTLIVPGRRGSYRLATSDKQS